ncbi:MAG: response regulator transcription factor [Endomicrobiia bacterium]|nr:response regulator transcription factor [Endomicrobiia bacterium]
MEKSVGRVMVVDDDPAICDLLKSALEIEGFAVDVCENDSDVSIALSKFHPDAILMDASMPGLDGISLCRHIKQTPATASIPIMIVSAYDDDKTRHDAALFGADDFVAKPFDVKFLVGKIKKLAGW